MDANIDLMNNNESIFPGPIICLITINFWWFFGGITSSKVSKNQWRGKQLPAMTATVAAAENLFSILLLLPSLFFPAAASSSKLSSLDSSSSSSSYWLKVMLGAMKKWGYTNSTVFEAMKNSANWKHYV